MIRLLALLPLLFAGCASSPDHKGEPVPEEKDRHRALQKAEERRRDINAVLLRLDQSIDSYVQALSNQGEIRADQAAERLERTIREMVLDQGPELTKVSGGGVTSVDALPPGENFRRLQALAVDGSEPRQQAIALAAIGFSEKLEMMPIILQGAQLSDPLVVDHAVMENYYNRKEPVPARGPISLQTHGGEIRWRNVFIREIGEREAKEILASGGKSIRKN